MQPGKGNVAGAVKNPGFEQFRRRNEAAFLWATV
jgi:hypothetical protein